MGSLFNAKFYGSPLLVTPDNRNRDTA